MRPALATVFVLAAVVAFFNWYGPWPPQARSAPPSASAVVFHTAVPTLATPVEIPTPSASPTAAPRMPEGYRVKVPRLAIDLPIAEGDIQRDIDLQKTPENFAFHLPGTSIPGRGSNTYLYAHARRGMFLSLWDARVGDEVMIVAPDGKVLQYVVTDVLPKVAPTDISVAQPTPDETLTLQTSTGPIPENPRFVVIAKPK